MSKVSEKTCKKTSKRDPRQSLQAMRDVKKVSGETLRDIASKRGQLEKRAGVSAGTPSQMLEMAKRFGLEESDIAQPHWRALEIIDTCRHCEVSAACFNYLVGDRLGDFTEANCPNAERYAEASLESSKTR